MSECPAMRPGRHAWLYALLFSFAAYLVPLIGPHAFTLLGERLWRDLTRGDREPSWIAADFILALALQAAAFAALLWSLRKPTPLRVLPVVVAAPVVGIAFQYAYQVYVPSRFLI